MKNKKLYITAPFLLLLVVLLSSSFSFFSFVIQLLPFIIFITPLFFLNKVISFLNPKKIKKSLHSESIFQKRLKRFKSIKRGYYSLIILIVLYVISLIGPLWMNDKPLIVYFANGVYDEGENYEDINANNKYDQGIDTFTDKHRFYFPAVKDFFGLNGDIPSEVFNLDSEDKIVNFKGLDEVLKTEDSGNYMIMPIYKFSPTEIYSDDLDDKFIDSNNNNIWDAGCGSLIELNLKNHLYYEQYTNQENGLSGFSYEGGVIPSGCGTLTNLNNIDFVQEIILIDSNTYRIDFDYYDQWCKNNLSECLKLNLDPDDVELGQAINTNIDGNPFTFKEWEKWCYEDTQNCLQQNLADITDACDLPENTVYLKGDNSILYNLSSNISKFNIELLNENFNIIATGGDAENYGYKKFERNLNGIILNSDNDIVEFSYFDSEGNDINDGCSLPENHLYLSENDKILYNTSTDISGFQFNIYGSTIYNVIGNDSEKNTFTISECHEKNIQNKDYLFGLGAYSMEGENEIQYIVNAVEEFSSKPVDNYCKNSNTKLGNDITILGYSLNGDLIPSKAEVLTYDANGNGKWDALSPPSLPLGNNILGTEESGRDVFARLVDGYRVSITFAIIVSTLGYSIGIIIGACLGYFGGRLDLLGVRLIEIFSSVPFLFVLMILAGFMKPSLFLLALLSVLLKGWIGITMYIRGEFFREKPKDYVSAAVSMGQSNWKIMFKHILPNSLTPIITFAPFSIIADIGTLVSLDFLGYGLQPTTSSWGALLRQGAANLDNYHLLIFPVIALTLTIFMITFISEAVREAFDPRIYSRLR